MRYLLNQHFQEVPEHYAFKPEDQILEFLTFEEAKKSCKNLSHQRVLLRNLREEISCCKVEMLPDAIIGTLLIPDKSAPLTSKVSLVFYFDIHHLIIIDDPKHMEGIQTLLMDEFFMSFDNIHRFFIEFLEYLIEGDMQFLQNYEKKLATMEESLNEILPRELKANVITERRELLLFRSYYQQLLDMFEIMSDNSNHLFPEACTVQLQRIASRVDRLYDNTLILREYAYQIREMHQSQIDVRQNDTMRILTVVTTLFLPLSLITGWYGMNFNNMPELQNPFSYFALIGVCVLIIVGEIWYFKKKGWL